MYYLETLEKTEYRNSSGIRYIYHLKTYQSEKDLLGSDTKWGYILKSHFDALKNACKEWKIERKRPREKKGLFEIQSKYKFKTFYSREVTDWKDLAIARVKKPIVFFLTPQN